MNKQQQQNLQEKAFRLERQQAIRHLIAYLTGAPVESITTPGRYARFGELLDRHPALLQALLANDRALIKSEWAQAQAGAQHEMPFLHALTIIRWETALARLEQQQAVEREWFSATGLWIMLLSADAFWDYFAQDRWPDEQGERRTLNVQRQEELRQNIINDILTLHSASARQFFATGNYKAARVHLACLNMCREKSQQFFTLLQKYALPRLTDLNEQTLDWIATRAFKTLDEWCVGLVADAEKEANDADAIKQLPAGIRLNYSGGIRVLQPFISLRIPVMRVLCTALDWYNEWRYDLHVLKDMQQQQEQAQAAQEIVDQLLQLSEKGKGYARENKLLSQHFLLRGATLDDSAIAEKQFAEALAWDPTNRNAQDLREQAFNAIYLDPVTKFIDQNEFEKAHKALDEAEQHISDTALIQRSRGLLYFVQGQESANAGKYREALSFAQRSCQLVPNEEALQRLLEQMEELAPEEEYVQIVQEAEKALDNEQFARVISEAGRVPNTSKIFPRACSIMAIAHFKQGIAALKRNGLENAESEMRKAILLYRGTDEEVRKTFNEGLSVAINARAVQIVEAASVHTRTETARRACKMLEEALVLDPGNKTAQENLRKIRALS